MPELVAIWVAGIAILLVFGGLSAAILRFTKLGRSQDVTLEEVLKVLVVCIALSCAVISLLALVS